MTDLILVPTRQEKDLLSPRLQTHCEASGGELHLCGFGPIAAAARTAALVDRYQPQRVLLVGIAGSFDVQSHPIGTARRFDAVACYGIGAGSGHEFVSAETLGWNQFGGSSSRPGIGDVIPLATTQATTVATTVATQSLRHSQLLTGCAASATAADVQLRGQTWPDAIAEDMEGFGVAMACRLAGVPLQIVRGLSNLAGDRDHDHWRIDDALSSAADLATQIIGQPWILSPRHGK